MEKTDKLIKEYIAPILKKYGFKKRKHKWNRKRDSFIDIILISHSKSRSKELGESIYFDISISNSEYVNILLNEEKEFLDIRDGILTFRLHDLLDESYSSFTELRNLDVVDTKNLGEKIIRVIEDKLMPFIESISSFNEMYSKFHFIYKEKKKMKYADYVRIRILPYYFLVSKIDKKDESLDLFKDISKTIWKEKALKIAKIE